MSVFKIPYFLSVLTPKALFFRGLTNDKNCLPSQYFSRAVRIRIYRLKREDIGNMFPICASAGILNICSEPFVMVLNVRTARPASTKVKFVTLMMRQRLELWIHGKLYFCFSHFCRYKLFNSRNYLGFETDPHVIN